MREKTTLPDPSVRCESRTRRGVRNHLWRCRLEVNHPGKHACHRRYWTDAEAVTDFGKRLPRYDGLCRRCGEEPRSPTTNNGLGASCLREHRKRYTKAVREPESLILRRWTEPELQKLRDEWGKFPPRDLVARFGRSYEALRCRAHILGLKTGRKGSYPHKHDNDFGCTCAVVTNPRRHWSPDDVAILEIRYTRGDDLHAIARDLKRTFWAVREKARALGMQRMDDYEDEEAVA